MCTLEDLASIRMERLAAQSEARSLRALRSIALISKMLRKIQGPVAADILIASKNVPISRAPSIADGRAVGLSRVEESVITGSESPFASTSILADSERLLKIC